eukprot:scaffold529_cov196-Alexandrium_tamarense.AAC.56
MDDLPALDGDDENEESAMEQAPGRRWVSWSCPFLQASSSSKHCVSLTHSLEEIDARDMIIRILAPGAVKGGEYGTFPPQHICPQTTREPARYFWTTVDKCIRDVKAIEKTAQTQYEGSGIVRQIGCRSCRVQAIWMGPRELEWRRRIYSHSISNAYIHVETV